MAVTLYVDAARWRRHLSQTITASPGLIPVIKGCGYGFGLDLLVAEASRLHGSHGVGTVAVGTYCEAPVALGVFPGDVLVMEPYRPSIHGSLAHLSHPSLVHTVTYGADVADLVGRVGRPRVVVEGLSSMNRHGVPAPYLGETLASLGDAELVAVGLHLPLGTGHLEEIRRWVDLVDGLADGSEQSGTPVDRWQVSHVTPAELASLSAAYPRRSFEARVGTELWLGDPVALVVRAHVLDVRPVARGDHAGYRQRRLAAGHLLVVSGGTSHGVALEAPRAVDSVRGRVIVLAESALEAAGRVRSPFTVSGRNAWFVEPPHMQVSLLSLPDGVTPPAVGAEVEVRVRLTILRADAVTLR